MPDEDLVKLLYDIQVAEVSIQTVSKEQKDSVIAIFYDQIYELHGINEEILLKNIEVLKKSPIKSHKIYKKVTEYHKKMSKNQKK